MTVLAIGVSAVFAAFLSSELAIQRASRSTTAMSVLDVRMESLRSIPYASIGLTSAAVTGSDTTYKADSAYRGVDPNTNAIYNETNEAVTIGSSALAPTTTVVGADGRNYRVDLYLTWQAVSSGRNVKLATIVVRDPATPYATRARASATFDQSGG